MHIKNFLPLLAIGLGLETGLAQSNIQVSDATKLLAVLQSPREKPVLVNFWATWCKPCVAELPHFEQVMKENADAYDMIYVSLDMVEELSERVEPFVKKKGLSGTHILLDDADLNAFIGAVHPQWSGAIPATLLLESSGQKFFHEGAFTLNELKTFVKDNLKLN